MLLLSSTTTVLRVISSSTSGLDVYCSYIDNDTAATTPITGGYTPTKITTAATTTIVAAPGNATTLRAVKAVSIENVGGAANTVTVQVFNGTTAYQIESTTLAAGERLRYNESTGWSVKDALARERVETAPVQSGGANVGLTANAADTYMGGVLLSGRIQQGSAIRWRVLISKTAAGVAAPILTFRVGTAGTVADTARVTLTSPYAQTAVADTGIIEATATIRTLSTTGVLVAGYQFNHSLAATGFATQPAYGQSAASAAFDLTLPGLIFGLSINPGTAGVWTCDASIDTSFLTA